MPKNQVLAAAIDLGSNSFRLLIGCQTERGLTSLLKKRATVRLAGGLNESGAFTPESIHRALTALKTFRSAIELFDVSMRRCCGTETFRRSLSPETLSIPAGKILDTQIEILTGPEEAELSGHGVVNALGDKLFFPCLIVDVGGGSTELILLRSANSHPVVCSLPIGAVMASKRDQAARRQDLHSLAASVKNLLREADLDTLPMLVGNGGTASSLATLDQELPYHEINMINGHFLSRPRIDEIYHALIPLNMGQRKSRKGLEPGREDIIIPGLEIYQEILATIGCEGMIVSDAGLLEGILLSMTGA